MPSDANERMRAPFVKAEFELFGGSLQLQSCSGGLEALWIRLLDEEGHTVKVDKATMTPMPAAVRITPSVARKIGKALLAYAASHKETPE